MASALLQDGVPEDLLALPGLYEPVSYSALAFCPITVYILLSTTSLHKGVKVSLS